MKLKAFTLSEVLVTMTIVGIVAIMTIPALIQKHRTVEYTSRAKKTYSEVSNAITEILRQGEVKKLSAMDFENNQASLISGVMKIISTNNSFGYTTHYLNGQNYSITTDKVYLLPDGAMFAINKKEGADPGYKLIIDVNGKKEPNTIGRDIFYYWIRENGSIEPNGSVNIASGSMQNSDCNQNGFACAAKIIEDGWEMNY